MTRRYNLEQQQRLCERNIRKYKRLAAGCIDAENISKYSEKRKQWTDEHDNLIASNSDVLRKDKNRLKLHDLK